MAFADHGAARVAIEQLQSAVASLQSAANAVISKSRLGTGTPAAGRYVDGGTGAWTQLPSAPDLTPFDARLDILEAKPPSPQVYVQNAPGASYLLAPEADIYIGYDNLPAGRGAGSLEIIVQETV